MKKAFPKTNAHLNICIAICATVDLLSASLIHFKSGFINMLNGLIIKLNFAIEFENLVIALSKKCLLHTLLPAYLIRECVCYIFYVATLIIRISHF